MDEMTIDQFLATVQASHDQALAHCRDACRQAEPGRLKEYAERLGAEMKSANPAKALRAHFAVLGLMAAILSAVEAEKAEET